MGHPPEPVSAWVAAMYTVSRSGRSSRSTLTEMNHLARSAAAAGSSKLSWAMTWHQWHDAYPMERKIGLSSSRARRRASSPHGNHSTGLSACWRRYGLVSSARWFTRGMLGPSPGEAPHAEAPVQGSGHGARTEGKDGTHHGREPRHRS